MSMRTYPIMMFGVNAADVSIKKEFFNPKFWVDESIPESEKPKYEGITDFLDGEISESDIGWAAGDDNDPGCYYIGIHAGYAWQASKSMPQTEEAAREYIANALAPFCNSTKQEIMDACDYIETTYCG